MGKTKQVGQRVPIDDIEYVYAHFYEAFAELPISDEWLAKWKPIVEYINKWEGGRKRAARSQQHT